MAFFDSASHRGARLVLRTVRRLTLNCLLVFYFLEVRIDYVFFLRLGF